MDFKKVLMLSKREISKEIHYAKKLEDDKYLVYGSDTRKPPIKYWISVRDDKLTILREEV